MYIHGDSCIDAVGIRRRVQCIYMETAVLMQSVHGDVYSVYIHGDSCIDAVGTRRCVQCIYMETAVLMQSVHGDVYSVHTWRQLY